MVKLKENITEEDLVKVGFFIEDAPVGRVARRKGSTQKNEIYILLKPPKKELRWRFQNLSIKNGERSLKKEVGDIFEEFFEYCNE